MGLFDLILIIAIIACLIIFWNKYGRTTISVTTENMAPLDFGSYPNNYPRGECVTGSMRRKECEIGSCNLYAPISHERYCGIVHAQDSDPEIRHENIRRCIDEMADGYCD